MEMLGLSASGLATKIEKRAYDRFQRTLPYHFILQQTLAQYGMMD